MNVRFILLTILTTRRTQRSHNRQHQLSTRHNRTITLQRQIRRRQTRIIRQRQLTKRRTRSNNLRLTGRIQRTSSRSQGPRHITYSHRSLTRHSRIKTTRLMNLTSHHTINRHTLRNNTSITSRSQNRTHLHTH